MRDRFSLSRFQKVGLIVLFIGLLIGSFLWNEFGSSRQNEKDQDMIQELDEKQKKVEDEDKDKESPIITLETTSLALPRGASIRYEKLIVKVRDNKSKGLKSQVTWNEIDTDNVGDYEIVYSVKDEAGNVGTTTIKVSIKEDELDCSFSPQENWELPSEEKLTRKDEAPVNKTFKVKDYDNLQQALEKAKSYGDSFGVEYEIKQTSNAYEVVFK